MTNVHPVTIAELLVDAVAVEVGVPVNRQWSGDVVEWECRLTVDDWRLVIERDR